MKAYFVSEQEAEWGLVVVAETARQALTMGRKAIMGMDEYAEFLCVRAKLLNGITPPPEIECPVVLVSCGEGAWTCPAWTYDKDCSTCPLGEAKYKEMWAEQEGRDE